jgi:hypothetical protein
MCAAYIGATPVPQATQTRQTFVATAAQTSFATAGYQAGYLDTFLNGVKLQDGVDYTATNGSDIVLTVGAALDDTLEVVAYTAFEVVNAATAAQGALADTAVQPNDSPTLADLTLTGSLDIGNLGSIKPDASGTGFLVIGKADACLGFIPESFDSGSRRIIPRQLDTVNSSNGVLDLGDSGSKFRDIHIGGRVMYHTYPVNMELQRTYKQWGTATSSISGSWVVANGSQLAFTPKRPDTLISIFAHVKTSQAWSSPSGINHGSVEWRIVGQNATGTHYGPIYKDWARVDNFSGIFEKEHGGSNEFHMSSNNDGSTLTISVEFRTTRTFGTGLSNGGVNIWTGLSVYTVHEVLV